jgi:hypothetical protein
VDGTHNDWSGRCQHERHQPHGNGKCCAQANVSLRRIRASRASPGYRALAVVSGGTTNGTTCSLDSKLDRYWVAAC